jgi:hypothetical protein
LYNTLLQTSGQLPFFATWATRLDVVALQDPNSDLRPPRPISDRLSFQSPLLSFTTLLPTGTVHSMNSLEHTIPSNDNASPGGRQNSPPAFLDLADSVRCLCPDTPQGSHPAPDSPHSQAARLGTNIPDMTAVSLDIPVPHTHR